ncbi:8-demethyl-8-(2, 3-dimethoxy-alpha-L-rhamnosyl)-tetracenomycin-C 4'-O-methyltransferase [Burkholderiales bacterium]|nr:8-demethyl-8-(2, 3-dimethoxy-alpha-L-rhamnosyl)-tetracenomycin-C 4'-O-methyltransferase [Burkholderiales bacterium]
MKGPGRRGATRRVLRSLVKRGGVALADASGSYAVQHLPEWIAKTSFDFARWRELWVAQNPRNDRADLARLVMFLENARLVDVEGIAGSLAELGVYQGTTAKLLHALLPDRTLWLFDTFEGFDERDLAHERGGASGGFRFDDTSLERVMRHIGASERVRPCKGHFPATAAAVPDGERFALVHLDADLRKPTADALAFFYPRMAPGGFMILHDYGSGAWPGIAEAVDGFFADKPESIVRIPDKSGTAIVRRVKR